MIDEDKTFKRHEALETRKRRERHTFEPDFTDKEIHNTFKDYGEVRLIKDIPYADKRIDPYTWEIATKHREVYVMTTNENAVAAAIDRSMRIKGRYVQKVEQKTTTVSLTQILVQMNETMKATEHHTPQIPE